MSNRISTISMTLSNLQGH